MGMSFESASREAWTAGVKAASSGMPSRYVMQYCAFDYLQ